MRYRSKVIHKVVQNWEQKEQLVAVKCLLEDETGLDVKPSNTITFGQLFAQVSMDGRFNDFYF